MDLEPISLPASWDAARDCAYFDERWDAVPSYAAALGEWMRFHHGAHVRTLNTALRYFRGHDADRADMALGGLTPGEKVALLQEIAARSPRVAAYRPRLLETLVGSAFAEAERVRVLGEYLRAGEHAWMYPVIEAIDYVGTAAVELDETLNCETEDYRMFKARFDGRDD